MDNAVTELKWHEHRKDSRYDENAWYIVRDESTLLGVRYCVCIWTHRNGFFNAMNDYRNVTHVAHFIKPFNRDK
jgi:hypothetical protein